MKNEFIQIVDEDCRTSSLMIDRKTNKLVVIGVLLHTTEFAPKSIEDCDKLIAFLQEWRKTQI